MNSNDLQVYAALANGRVSSTLVNTGVVQNVFAHVTSGQRAEGLEDYALTHWKVADSDNGHLIDPEAYQDFPTLSPSDYVVMTEVGQRVALADRQAVIDAAEKYGTGILEANIAVNDTTFSVTVKHANLLPGGVDDIFRNGGKVKVCSTSSALATDGYEEVKTLAAQPTFEGLVVNCVATEPFVNAFTANEVTRVSSLIKPAGDIQTSHTEPVKNSASGVIDLNTYSITLDNIGTPEEDLTFDFTDATHFDCSGDTLEHLGSGMVGTDFVVMNDAFTREMIRIPAGLLTGTWQAGDSFTLTIHPATLPIGQKRHVDALAASLANNKVTQVFGGEASV